MFSTWIDNINESVAIVARNEGPSLAIAVSGSEIDQQFWRYRFLLTGKHVFRQDGNVEVISTLETTKKGSFLGVFNAWNDAIRFIRTESGGLPDIAVMSLVFGKGTRFSPFTQTEGNRKSAFWTPLRTASDTYLNTADISNLSVNLWVEHLRNGGFQGIVVKWGDELIIPGESWHSRDYREIDAFRCVGKIEITESLAREKDWVVVDSSTGLMRYQFARQDLGSLKNRLSSLAHDTYELRINLGSVILSYDFLNAALEVFQEDIADPKRWADWDPYVWMALCCEDEAQWRQEAENERRAGRFGIDNLEANYPDFYPKILAWRRNLERRTGRPLAIGTLEFGNSFWLDFGLHLPLRMNLDSLTKESEPGKTIRHLFNIPEARDSNGNIIVRSTVPASATIRNSLIIDSVIRDGDSVINGGQIVKSKLGRVSMPQGGSSLFCAVNQMECNGTDIVAYKSLGSKVVLEEGDRHSTLLLPDRHLQMLSNERITDYSSGNYTDAIMGNALSFDEAGVLMARQDGRQIETEWQRLWDSFRE